MKTQKNKFAKTLSLVLGLFMVVTFTLFSCSSSDDGGGDSGSFTYDGETYNLNMAMYTYYSGSERIKIQFVGSDNGYLIVEWDERSNIPIGEFTRNGSSNYDTEIHFRRGEVVIDITEEAYVELGSKVIVKSLGNNKYEVSFDWTTDENKSLTGSYKGTIFKNGDSD